MRRELVHCMRFAFCAFLLFAAAFTSGGLQAASADYPSRPVRMIVPYAPGGGTDIMARAVAAKVSERWGQQIVVDNRAGGGTLIGTEMAARSPADGYTILITAPSFVINPSTRPKLPYDTLKDFVAVTQIGFQPYVLVVHPKVPARDVKEFIALARAKPDYLNFGSTGVGSGSHLAGELLRIMTETNLTHIAYKGMGPAIADLLGGQTQFICATILPVTPHVRAGRLRALGVSSEKRSAILPDLPTIAEAGVPGYSTISWTGVHLPAGASRAVVEKVHAEVVRAIATPEVGERIAADGAEPAGTSIAEFDRFIRNEIAKWGKVIKASGIQIQ
jgi:tripartite-type tricarboxylate transporter receptor subunit TctC